MAAATLAACGGGPNLKPDQPAGVNLAGTWRLNRQASQDPQAMLNSLQEKLIKQMRPRRYAGNGPPDPLDGVFDDDDEPDNGSQRGASGSSGGRSAGQHGVEHGQGTPRRRFIPQLSYTRALGSALSNDSLAIDQSPTRLVFTRGEDRRSYTPGADSVVSVADGVADQRSGWAGREYVIDVRPQVGAHVTQRYTLSPDGRQLLEKYTLTDEGLPKLEFTRVYDPGKLSPRPLPTSN